MLNKKEKINRQLTGAKARFFGFAKIVTERGFLVNNYLLSIMMTKDDDSANVGISFHESAARRGDTGELILNFEF